MATNLPESAGGRIEHQFLVYGAVVLWFIEVKKELFTGKAKLRKFSPRRTVLLHRYGVLRILTRLTQFRPVRPDSW